MSPPDQPADARQDAPGAEERLLAAAAKARAQAYAPYSGFAVGAALECGSGRIVTGSNVENASYGTTICAERVALFKAVSEGEREFTRLAVVSEGVPPIPCGACRQALAEFAPELDVLVRGSSGLRRRRLSDLLPEPFRLAPAGGPPKPATS
jgi:cytidine deaminase